MKAGHEQSWAKVKRDWFNLLALWIKHLSVLALGSRTGRVRGADRADGEFMDY